MHKTLTHLISYGIVAFAIVSCTNFQEEEAPVNFGVDTNQLDFAIAPSTRSVTVSSGTKWDVSSMPSWVSLGAISRSGRSPYEWIANFSAVENDEYNREGKIIIKAGSDAVEISVTQEGRQGKYIAVESVSLSPTELTLTEGEKASLSFTITPSDASVKTVEWKTSDSSVATVSQTGEVEAIAKGTTIITITTEDGSKTSSCSVTVNSKVIPVTGVSLDRTSLSMTEGDTQTLTAIVTPSNASDKSIAWSSSNTSVATVSSTGVVTAKTAGSATITVTTNDGGKKATCTVTVYAKQIYITHIVADKQALTLDVGEDATLKTTIYPAKATNKQLVWKSTDNSIVSVDNSGRVTALKAGTATVYASPADGGGIALGTSIVIDGVGNLYLDGFHSGLNVERYDIPIIAKGENMKLWFDGVDTNCAVNNLYPAVVTIGSNRHWEINGRDTGLDCIGHQGPNKPYCNVTVQPKTIAVSGVSLDKTSLSMIVGDTQLLTASVTPENATDKSVVWSSSNTNVATVSSSGLVTAKMVGAAVITVSTKDGAKTATCSISVGYAIPVAIDLGLSVKWASFNIGAAKPEDTGYYYPWGETEPVAFNYGEFFFYTLDSYKWYNSSDRTLTKYCPIANYGHNGYTDNKTILDQNDDAAYVNLGTTWRMPTNEEFAQLKNKCTWRWTSANGVSGYSVTGPNGNSIFLPAAGFGTMMEFRNGGTQGYYWSSSLRTDYPYYAYSFSFGSSSYDNESRDRSSILPIRPVTGAPLISVTGVSLNKTSLTMTEGDTQTLTATVTPSNATDKSVAWSSSNTSVVTVSSSGVVTAKAAGSATITVTTNDGGKKATCSVTVQAQAIAVTGVTLNKTSLSMTVGDTQTLTATVTPSNATNKAVNWSSTNASVATVSSSGVVIAKAAGTASIIVATVDGGKTATCSVTVNSKTVSVTSVSLDSGVLGMDVGTTYTLIATVSPSNATDKSVSWTSSDTSVATVSSSGVVTAKAAGTAAITVTTNDGGKKATCSVSVLDPVELGTVSIKSISFSRAVISCPISYGHNMVLEKGVCVSTKPSLTPFDNEGIFLAATDEEMLSLVIDGLSQGTTYYVIAFVTTSSDYGRTGSSSTVYTKPVSFTTLRAPNYVVPGLFSVSSTKKVYIASGNLMQDGATEKYHIFEHQYDILGKTPAPTADVSFDLLTWAGFVGFSDIVEQSNGGSWRLMSSGEMTYLINNRANASKLKVTIVINNVTGLMLLPDDWVCPSSVSMPKDNDSIPLETWSALQNAGAVFLPCAGVYSNTYGVQDIGTKGKYSTSSKSTSGSSTSYYMISIPAGTSGLTNVGIGSVRLVIDY